MLYWASYRLETHVRACPKGPAYLTTLVDVRRKSSRKRTPTNKCIHGVPMPEMSLNLAESEGRIAVLRENIRELVEQAAAFSGAADEELVSQRIAKQEAQLELLTRQRDELLQQKS